MKKNIDIKPATFDDLRTIAHIHVKSWQQTYAGQIPQDYLDGLSIADKQEMWEKVFQNPSRDPGLYLAYQEEKAVGFISFGRCRDKDKADWGEIYAIYLLQGSWSQGIGYALFQNARHIMKDAGYDKACIWVLDTNERAIRAYERWGGKLDPKAIKNDMIANCPVREFMMTFDL